MCVIGLLFGILVGLNVAISDLGSEIFDILHGGKSEHFTFGYFRLWRSAGLVHCVPIIASSVCCQVQVNAIYSSLGDPSMSNMKKILISAVTFIFSCYLFAGLLGYIAFYNGSGATVAGDILAMYPEDNRAFHIRLGFLYTVAVSIPLILLPLRTALYSLLFEETFSEEGPLAVEVSPTIPDAHFRWLTVAIIFLSMVASQTTDKVEVILAYTGGLAGGTCCYLLPAAISARALGVRKRPLEMGMTILLLCGLGILILLSPFLTFLGVDS
nr:sodium coupled neutral amino acid [Hymenolepis microstoma]